MPSPCLNTRLRNTVVDLQQGDILQIKTETNSFKAVIIDEPTEVKKHPFPSDGILVILKGPQREYTLHIPSGKENRTLVFNSETQPCDGTPVTDLYKDVSGTSILSNATAEDLEIPIQ